MIIPLLIAISILIIIILTGFRIEQEYQRGIIFRIGRYKKVKGPGLYWIIPILDR